MPKREKKERGRPMEKGYPPRIDATPEEIARAVLKGGRPQGRVKSRTYRCGACGAGSPLPGDPVQRRAMPRMSRGLEMHPSAKLHYNSQVERYPKALGGHLPNCVRCDGRIAPVVGAVGPGGGDGPHQLAVGVGPSLGLKLRQEPGDCGPIQVKWYKPESTEGRPWGQPLKKLEGASLNLG